MKDNKKRLKAQKITEEVTILKARLSQILQQKPERQSWSRCFSGNNITDKMKLQEQLKKPKMRICSYYDCFYLIVIILLFT